MLFKKLKLQNLVNFITFNKVYTGNRLSSGSVLDVHFRRNLLEKSIYTFAGVCIAKRNKGSGSNVIVRNVISLYTLEYTFNLFSPLVQIIIRTPRKIRKSKMYYLRKKPAPLSSVSFKYIV